MQTPLVDALNETIKQKQLRYHMPGHAGHMVFSGLFKESMSDSICGLSPELFQYDVTELELLDVLSESSGVLAESQALVAKIYNAAHSFYLVQGSSVGLQSAMLALFKSGDKILLPRNAHRSIVSGLILTGAEPVWFYPELHTDWCLWGVVTLESLEAQLKADPTIKGVVITSPTYEGVTSDCAALAELCKQYDVALIVDEAHGSLFPFATDLPSSAVTSSADVVVQSLHKGGGCLTQGAIAHLPHGSRVSPQRFQQALNTLHTTSPSYPLLASMELAIAHLSTPETQDTLNTHVQRCQQLKASLKTSAPWLAFWESSVVVHDATRFIMRPVLENTTQQALNMAEVLELECGLAYESANRGHSLYMTGIGHVHNPALIDTFEERLIRSEPLIKQLSEKSAQQNIVFSEVLPPLPETAMTPRDAFFATGEVLPLDQCIGRVSRQTIVHCPPGVPVIQAGEKITQNLHAILSAQGCKELDVVT